MIRLGEPVSDAYVKELLTRCRVRQRNAEGFCTFQGQTEIFLMQLDPKSGLEIPFEQSFPMHLQNPGGGKAAHERLAYLGRICACLGRKHQSFADSLNR